VDVEPEVAKVRTYEIGRVLASRRVAKKPPAWRAFLEAEYEAMRQAASITTAAEQQQSQQAASEAQKATADAAAKLETEKVAVENKKADTDAERLKLDAAPKQAEPPKISVSAKLEDPLQVTELLAQHGIQLSPPTPPPMPIVVAGDEDGIGNR